MLISFTLDKDGFRVSKPLDARFVTNVTYIKAHFDVSEPTWSDAKVLVAVFKSATYNESCRMILDENNNCFVEPKVFMRGGTIQVKLCGDAYDSDWVRCTTHLTDTVEFFVRPESLLTAEPPSKYAVFLAEIERLREEYAGSGVGGTSKQVSIPSISSSLQIQSKEFRSSLHLTIGGNNSQTGTLSFEIVGEKPTNYNFALVEDMYAISDFHLFEKLKGYMVREASTSVFVDLFFYSEEEVTIVGSDIYIRGLVFSDVSLPSSNICYIEGTCSSDDEGGDSAK